MSRRYDQRTSTFSPEGRLYQVEYAMEAINHAGATIGVTSKEGVVLVAEKKIQSKLLDDERNGQHSNTNSEKLHKIDNHLGVSVAGLTSDAAILINYSRVAAQRHTFTYNEPIPCEQLVHEICDLKQGYTQYGGIRPFGVSTLFAGWDVYNGFQLYHTDPSGNYNAWKAHSIGQNSAAAISLLKQDYKEDITLKGAVLLAVQVLSKSMDTATLSPEKLEFCTLTLKNNRPFFRILEKKEVSDIIAEAKEIRLQEEKEKEAKEKEKKEKEKQMELAKAKTQEAKK